ncbi:MAG: tetratricopeptide repeat protein [Desulfobacterium sp.]|jgi:TolA-binding protein|nr:tetratricopeptide repeat protein [Desulfobacterium sp.]
MAEQITRESFLDEWENTKKGVVQHMDGQQSVCASMNIDKKGLGMIYQNAYRAFEAEDYTQAENLFFILFLLDSKDHNFQTGLGAAYEAQEKFDNAIAMYSLAMMRNGRSPQLLFRTGKCLLATNRRDEARIIFELAAESDITDQNHPQENSVDRLVSIEQSKKMLGLLNG